MDSAQQTKLTDEQIQEIRSSMSLDIELAKKYKVRPFTIAKIRNKNNTIYSVEMSKQRGRPKKNPDAVTFDFKLNPNKELAKTTLSNYKNSLNRLTESSVFEHERDATKPIIRTKEDLMNHTAHVLWLLQEHIEKRLTKSTTLAAIFYIIGRQDEPNHPYVTEFRKLYYTESWKATLEERAKLNSAAQPLVVDGTVETD
jgi:hypothetical protein